MNRRAPVGALLLWGYNVRMKILTYSPSIEAYAAVTGNGDVAYYDLSSDITRATISRKSDTASSFTLHLLNKNGKYNDVFSPMDRVKIYLTKSKRYAVLSGYIKSAPKFNLYRSELSITGYDTIYRLQELFWDPQLIASQQQLGYSTTIGWEGVIMNLLVNVAGYDPTTVKIGSIPSEVIDWAHELYAAKQTDIEQARNMVNEFYEVLRTSGPTVGSVTGTESGSEQLGEGQTIEVPPDVPQGKFYTVTCYDQFEYRWAAGTNQRRVCDLWQNAGRVYTDGIATVNGRWLMACSETFGACGDYVDFKLEGGLTLQCIIADIKSSGDANYSKWGHVTGGLVNIIEFEVSSEYYYRYGNPGQGGWKDEWGGKGVLSATNYGSALR